MYLRHFLNYSIHSFEEGKKIHMQVPNGTCTYIYIFVHFNVQ